MLVVFITIALSLSLNVINIEDNSNWIYQIIKKFCYSLNMDMFRAIAIFGFTYFLLEKKDSTKNKNKFTTVLAVIFASCIIIGYSFYKTNSFELIFSNKFQLTKSIIMFLGYCSIIKLILDYLFENILPKIKYKNLNNRWFQFIFEKHAFILPLMILLLCWLPYVVIYYPGMLTYDAEYQIEQYYGMDISATSCTNSVNLISDDVKITNHHPVLHTVILGTAVKIGELMSNYNFRTVLIYNNSNTLISSYIGIYNKFYEKNKNQYKNKNSIINYICLITNFSILCDTDYQRCTIHMYVYNIYL